MFNRPVYRLSQLRIEKESNNPVYWCVRQSEWLLPIFCSLLWYRYIKKIPVILEC